MPEDEVPAAPFSSGRLSATENGLERVNGSLPTTTKSVVGREVGQTPGRQRRQTSQRKVATTRDKRTGRGQPPNTAGGNTTRGKQPTGKPHPPSPPPPRVLYKKRAAVQDWQRWEKILGLPRETKGTPHCWLM